MQGHVTQTLSNAIAAGRVHHAILFSGPRGTGKTTVARILAKALNCEKGPTCTPCNACRSCNEITADNSADVFEIDGASNNGVEHIRNLRENVKYAPVYSTYKIYIIDEVHMLSTSAFNALLKTLEEPPAHVTFIFATTEPHKIPVTIISRCQHHNFKLININSISEHIKTVCSQEHVDISEKSIDLLARQSGGSMRDALSLLDLVITCTEKTITHEQVLNILGIFDRKMLFEISKSMLCGNIADLLEKLDELYIQGYSLQKFYYDLMEHFRNLMVVKIGQNINKLVNAPVHEIEMMKQQTQNITLLFLHQIFDLLCKEENTIKISTQPKLAIEMVFVKIFQTKPAIPIDVLIEKIDSLRQNSLITQKNPINNIEKKPDEKKFQQHSNDKLITFTEKPDEKKTVSVSIDNQNTGLDTYHQNTGLDTDNQNTGLDTYHQNVDLDTIWKKILHDISEDNLLLFTNLANSTLKKLTDQDIEIDIVDTEFAYNMVKRQKSMTALKKVCKIFFNKDMQIKITHRLSNSPQKQMEQSNHLEKKALSHPLVADIIEIFNGTVEKVKILKEV